MLKSDYAGWAVGEVHHDNYEYVMLTLSSSTISSMYLCPDTAERLATALLISAKACREMNQSEAEE